MRQAKEYRELAREHLEGGLFGNKFLYAVFVVFVVVAINGVVSATGIGIVASVVFVGPFTYGMIRIFLRVVRREDDRASIGCLFDGFKEKIVPSIITSLLTSLFTLLWSLLLIVPGLIKSYSYAATMYLVHEKNMEGNEAITASRKLMDGHKWSLFCLDLSFIGWYLLGTLCLGVGLFWADAYHEIARAEFFNDLLKYSDVIDIR